MIDLTILCLMSSIGLAVLVQIPALKKSRWGLGTLGFIMGIVAVCAILTDETLDYREDLMLIPPCLMATTLSGAGMLEAKV